MNDACYFVPLLMAVTGKAVWWCKRRVQGMAAIARAAELNDSPPRSFLKSKGPTSQENEGPLPSFLDPGGVRMTTTLTLNLYRLFVATLLFATGLSMAADTADEAGIRKVMQTTWDKPDARLEVGPVVSIGNHAVAGWTQGGRGGRALLTRDKNGQWSVAACAGDGLKQAKTLESAGLSQADAKRLSESLASAEGAVPKARLALFSTFDGMVRMDAHGHQPAHTASGTAH